MIMSEDVIRIHRAMENNNINKKVLSEVKDKLNEIAWNSVCNTECNGLMKEGLQASILAMDCLKLLGLDINRKDEIDEVISQFSYKL